MKLWRRKEKAKTQIRYFPKQQMWINFCYEQNTILLVCPIRYKFLIHTVENMIHFKVLMQGKLIAVAYTSAYILKPVLSGRNL